MTRSISTALVLIAVCVIACSKKEDNAALDALDSLRKIQAAIQVGVSLPQYTQLLIDAKAKTNAADRSLPDGPLKAELNSIIATYQDASRVWQLKAEGRRINRGNPDQNDLLVRYSIPAEPDPPNADEVIQAIWGIANQRMGRAEQLVSSK